MATIFIADRITNSASDESHFINLLVGSQSETYSEDLNHLVEKFALKGWTRKYFYELCLYAINNVEFPTKQFDALDNFITALTGECHPDYIVKLPNDPVDSAEFLDYVWSKRWDT